MELFITRYVYNLPTKCLGHITKLPLSYPKIYPTAIKSKILTKIWISTEMANFGKKYQSRAPWSPRPIWRQVKLRRIFMKQWAAFGQGDHKRKRLVLPDKGYNWFREKPKIKLTEVIKIRKILTMFVLHDYKCPYLIICYSFYKHKNQKSIEREK